MKTNYYNTKEVKDILKEVKGYLKEGKTSDKICELIDGSTCDSYLFGNDEIIHITIKKTRFVGNFLKKNFTPDEYDIKKIKQDIDEESFNIIIDYEIKEIKADTKCIIEYKDGFIQEDYYEIAHIKF